MFQDGKKPLQIAAGLQGSHHNHPQGATCTALLLWLLFEQEDST